MFDTLYTKMSELVFAFVSYTWFIFPVTSYLLAWRRPHNRRFSYQGLFAAICFLIVILSLKLVSYIYIIVIN